MSDWRYCCRWCCWKIYFTHDKRLQCFCTPPSILFKCSKVTADAWLSLSWEQINQWAGSRLPTCYYSTTQAATQSVLVLVVESVLIVIKPEHIVKKRNSVPVHSFSHAVTPVCLPARMAQWGAVFSIIAALGGAALLASVHKIDEGHTGVYYRWDSSTHCGLSSFFLNVVPETLVLNCFIKL